MEWIFADRRVPVLLRPVGKYHFQQLVAFAYENSKVSSHTVGCADCDLGLYQAIGLQIPLGNMLALVSEND